jgi:hypothetical protein
MRTQSFVYFLPRPCQPGPRHRVALGSLCSLPGGVVFHVALGREVLSMDEQHRATIRLILEDLDTWQRIDRLPISTGPQVVLEQR